jgi:hypothetical protein
MEAFVDFNGEGAVGDGKRRLRLHSPRAAASTVDTQAAHTGLPRETAMAVRSALMRNASLFFISMIEANPLDRLALLLHLWKQNGVALGSGAGLSGAQCREEVTDKGQSWTRGRAQEKRREEVKGKCKWP